MAILFSPIGTADPITTLGDGPMLHIVRNRRPSKVVLFLSPKMASYQRKDQRYTKAIELLASYEGNAAPEVRLIESSVREVHRFDLYIDEFESILKGLAGAREHVLVNVSSGTAGMAQALVALGSFGRLDIELLQVPTPRNDTNRRDDREDPDNYDLESLWELDSVLEDGAPDRVFTVQTPNFAERLLRENVNSLCRNFEFEAANELIKKMHTAGDETKRLVAAAAARLNLDGNLAASAFGGTELRYKGDDLLLEYLYVMEARLQQGHYADFVRALSPAYTELLKRCLRTCLPAERFMVTKPIYKGGKQIGHKDIYNVDAIRADRKLSETLKPFHYDQENKIIYNAAFMALVNAYCEDRDTVAKLQRVRDVEEKVRNSLAHSLRVSSRSAIERQCGISLDETMSILFNLHGSAKPGLYKRISEAIDMSLNGTKA